MKYLLIGLLKLYRLVISPLYGDVCRYYPTCSAYALRAVQFHGAIKGTWLTLRRLSRCHPWAAGGYDPVPGTPEFDQEMRDLVGPTATMEPDPPLRPAQHALLDRLKVPHRHWRHDRAAMVAQPRGVN